MTENKRRFKTIIAGKTYTIVGNKAPEHLTAVSELVNAQLEQIKEAAPALGREERGILVAVNAISDQLTKQLEIEELLQKVAMLEKALQESEASAEPTAVPETAEGTTEAEQKPAESGDATHSAAEAEEGESAAKTPPEAAPSEEQASRNDSSGEGKQDQRVVASMPATISELQQAARAANELPARKSNSKLSKPTTASEAALKRAQHRNQVRSALGVNRNAETTIPPFAKNKADDKSSK
ncbi:cell division protein ZapA [Trichococcus ilyis]|jgi:cell division protein ZapA (FtsZ GTPase activity inhibitor)|uniref:Cell division protein zapa n=1 Tax=Trichococcus ilyis TaxID=640938 RepID=A0A143YUT0_9LACT|nr:cell division protein ZapA [Trichococcus ilyis]CZQ98106.1 cell division protein zapa [Trichococcus ilyis]SEJ18700.1 Cell division protein ZapA, inhibits GTPase activity of FtsZ [Trichococcus ilyis]